MPERRTARRHRPRIGGRVRHRVVAEAKAYPDGVSTSNVLPMVAFEPSVGGPVLSAECGCWWQVLRVRLTLGVAGHEMVVRPDTALVAHVAGALAVAPRPAERRRRSALPGRGWERPPISANLDWRQGGWSRTAPSPPPLRVTPSQQSVRKGVERRFEAAEDVLADRLAAGLSGLAGQDQDALGPARLSPSRSLPLGCARNVVQGSGGCSPGQRLT